MLYFIYNNDELVGFKYNGNTYHYHKNLFGDVIGIYDSNNNEIVRYEYDSWGSPISVVDTSSIGLATINPFRYRSYYYDEETKLYYLNSRYYNPVFGRFINADGIINSNSDFISGNLYQYVSNNPVNSIDMTGSSATAVAGASVGGLASAISGALLGALKITLVIAAVIAVGTVIEKNIADTKQKNADKKKKNSNTHSVYTLNNGTEVVYVGRTVNLESRKAQHKKSHRKDLNMEVIREDLSYEEARGLEQILIEKYRTLNRCSDKSMYESKHNQINGIGDLNPNKNKYMDAGRKVLDFYTFDTETYVGGEMHEIK